MSGRAARAACQAGEPVAQVGGAVNVAGSGAQQACGADAGVWGVAGVGMGKGGFWGAVASVRDCNCGYRSMLCRTRWD